MMTFTGHCLNLLQIARLLNAACFAPRPQQQNVDAICRKDVAVMNWRFFLKRSDIALICIFPLILLFILLPTLPATAQSATPVQIPMTRTVGVQDIPPADMTVTALQKEQYALQNEQLRIENNWSIWTNVATPMTLIIGVATVLGGVWRYFQDQRTEREKQRELEKQQLVDRQAEREKHEGEQMRWLEDRKVEREKQADARFQKAIDGLGDNTSEVTRTNAAILLRTFLRQGYENFYVQAFDLAVAHLRQRHCDPDAVEPLTSLSRALITVFKEAFPLAREWLQQDPQALDATSIQLDHAYLSGTDLTNIWMPEAYLRMASLREANLSGANLSGANLKGADLSEADLSGVDLREAILDGVNLNKTNLNRANLSRANLSRANLSRADLRETIFARADLVGANLVGAILTEADLEKVHLSGADLFGAGLEKADLSGADLFGADLRKADLREVILIGADLSGAIFDDALLPGADLTGADLQGANIDAAGNLENTNLKGTKGLYADQLKACQAKGATISDILPRPDKAALSSPNSPSQNNQGEASSSY
jgi:uncharacterized protein YjbI with pentapeptide repeats